MRVHTDINDKIRNPRTNRLVKRDGRVARSIKNQTLLPYNFQELELYYNKPIKIKNKPIKQQLYNTVVALAKKKFDVWPSIYASSWVVSEYKKRGGTYTTKQPRNNNTGLTRWYKERWINVCDLPKIVACGRSDMKKKYPLCRPMFRVTKDTPKLVSELSAKELKRRCTVKGKDPYQKVY